MDTRFWGPSGWKLLHLITYGYPQEPTLENRHTYGLFFNSLKYIYSNFPENSEYMTLFLKNKFANIMTPLMYPEAEYFKSVRLTLDHFEDLKNCVLVGNYFDSYDFNYTQLCNFVKSHKFLDMADVYEDKAVYVKPKLRFSS